MKRIPMVIMTAVATALSGTVGASCILVDGSTTDRGACRTVYGETYQDDSSGHDRSQSLDYFNSIYRWSDSDVSYETWSYGATALGDSDGLSLSASTFANLHDYLQPPTDVSTKLGTATYRGRSTGAYALATPFARNVGAIQSDLELTADFTGGVLTGKFDHFVILLEAAAGEGWQGIPATITVAGRLLDDALVLTSAGIPLKVGAVGSGQLDSDFLWPSLTGAWRVRRNRVSGLAPELPDLPEFSVKASFVNDAAETIGTVETITPLTVLQGGSAGQLSLSMSFGADNAPVPAPQPPTAGMATDGLASSAASKMTATYPTTLATLFSTQPDNAYSPVSGALKRDFSDGTASLDEVLHVHSVQRTSTGGYIIVYTDGSTQHTIEFGSEHCRPGYCEIRGDGYHGLWAWTAADNEPLGQPKFWHMHALNLNANPGAGQESRIAFVFGLKTPAATLRTLGEAVYTGYTRMDARRAGDNHSSYRQRYSGNVRLVANFDISRLYGSIVNVNGSEPGGRRPDNPFPTSSFRISDGAIHDNGQFTATLTGMDSDASVLDKDSVRGVMGQILGEFYGLNGRTIGGVVTASRDLAGDENDLTFYGYFRGGKIGPAVDLAADAFVAGIDRDNRTNRSELLDDDGMARVERTANGWTVTVDGQTVAFDDAEDYGGRSGLSSNYWRDLGNDRAATLWTVTGGYDFGPYRFDHFDVKGWSFTTWVPGSDPATADFETDTVNANYVFVLHGNRTPAEDMPESGTATYEGSMAASELPTDDGVVSVLGSNSMRYRGDATLTVDFASSSVGGRLFNLERQPGDRSSDYADIQGDLTFDATIDGNQFTASAITGSQDMAGYGSGSARGAFFGPAAAEAGGVFDAADATNNRAMVGYLGGRKERDIAIDGSPQFSSLVNRDYGNSQTSIGTSDSATVTTTTEGYRITFTINGVHKTIDVTDADLGGISGNPANFEKVVETASVSRRVYLWRWEAEFPRESKYDYMDVNGVILAEYTPGVLQETTNLNDVSSGYVVRGTRTSTNDMPTGSASYSGRMQAREWPTDVLSSYTDADEYRGDFGMIADFAAGTVTGAVSNVVSRPSFSETDAASPSTGLTFQGTVSGNSITASSLSGTGAFAGYSGSVEGAFYGPDAAEVGGVFEASATDKLLQGYFAGDKE